MALISMIGVGYLGLGVWLIIAIVVGIVELTWLTGLSVLLLFVIGAMALRRAMVIKELDRMETDDD